jgi:hypothetical protein
MREEIFGPILPILTFNKFKEAIDIVNKMEKPLVIYYFGPHFSKNFSILEKRTSSGCLISNETMFHLMNSDMPFGGVGLSGYGRYHGYEGYKAFSNIKGVMHKPPINVFPYTSAYPPYTFTRRLAIKFFSTMKNFEKTSPLRWIIHAPFTYGPLAKL